MLLASQYVTRHHSCYGKVSNSTKVVRLGEGAVSLEHECRPKKAANNAPKRRVRIMLEQPIHALPAAGYCAGCDRLYVAEEPNFKENE